MYYLLQECKCLSACMSSKLALRLHTCETRVVCLCVAVAPAVCAHRRLRPYTCPLVLDFVYCVAALDPQGVSMFCNSGVPHVSLPPTRISMWPCVSSFCPSRAMAASTAHTHLNLAGTMLRRCDQLDY